MSNSISVSDGVNRKTKTSWLPLTVICVAQIMVVLNGSVTSVAIGSIVTDLNTSATTVQTGLVAFSLVTASLIITAGRLGGTFGSLNALRIGVGLFGIGELVIGLTPSAGGVIAGEAIAGLGAAILVPSLVALIVENYQGKQQATAVGFLGASAGIGGSVGLLAGGCIINTLGWRAGFFTIVALSLLTLVLSFILPNKRKLKGRLDLDFLSVLLSASGILTLVMGINQISVWGGFLAKPGSPFNLFGLSPVPLIIGIGIFLLQSFLSRQVDLWQNGRTPLLSPLVLDTPLERSSILLYIFSLAIPGALAFVVPLYTQLVQGASALQTALVLLPFALVLFIGAIASAKLATRFSPRQIVFISLIIEFIGLLMLAFTFANDWGTPVILLGLALVGGAIGVLISVLSMVLLSASPPELGGDVGALRGTGSSLGAALGPALVGVILLSALTGSASGLIERSQILPPEFKRSVDLSGAKFMSNAQLEQIITKIRGIDDTHKKELLNINTIARQDALKIAMLFAAGLPLLGLIPSRNLPDHRVDGQVTGHK